MRRFLNRLSLCLGIGFGCYVLIVLVVGPQIDHQFPRVDDLILLLVVVSIPWLVFFRTRPSPASRPLPTHDDRAA